MPRLSPSAANGNSFACQRCSWALCNTVGAYQWVWVFRTAGSALPMENPPGS